MKYLSAKQIAQKWNVSSRRVTILCNESRVLGSQKAGNVWIIPADAKKPVDARVKNGKYIKKHF